MDLIQHYHYLKRCRKKWKLDPMLINISAHQCYSIEATHLCGTKLYFSLALDLIACIKIKRIYYFSSHYVGSR